MTRKIRSQMKWALLQDYDVLLAEDRPARSRRFEKVGHGGASGPGPAAVPGAPEEGMAALAELLTLDNLTKVVIATGQAEKDNALRAIGWEPTTSCANRFRWRN